MKKIVVVDDEMSALQCFLEGILDQKDIDYMFFKDDVDKVLSYCSSHGAEGAFLDIKMPGIDGFSLANELIKINPSIKIVFVTGLNITEKDIPQELKDHLVGIAYKPINADILSKYLVAMEGNPVSFEAKMFGHFDCFINGRMITFSSSKSKELMSLVLYYRGKTISMDDAIFHLWPDGDYEKSKKLYRDAVWRLRKTLSDYGFNCVVFKRAQLFLAMAESIVCDYWDFVDGKKNSYYGEFLSGFDWSIDVLPILDDLQKKLYGVSYI